MSKPKQINLAIKVTYEDGQEREACGISLGIAGGVGVAMIDGAVMPLDLMVSTLKSVARSIEESAAKGQVFTTQKANFDA